MYEELKKAAESASQKSDGAPWAYEPHGDTGEFGVGILEDDQGNCVTGRQVSGEMLVLEPVAPEVSCEAYAAFIAAANPSAVLALIAENERLAKQWGERPAYRTPEYESKRDAMWRHAHMVATSKGYDHINMAIAAAPNACADCMGCGGEWQGEGVPNSICDTCKGSRGKALEVEAEALKEEIRELHRKIGGSATHPSKGHGHVFQRADGVRMRCGGPAMCKVCQDELAIKDSADQLKTENELLRKAVDFAAEAFGKITSSDGSGHADLATAVLRIAGKAMADAK